jgi:hypothetical protein
MQALTAYDPPPGDGVEDNPNIPLATDGNTATAWATEHYTTANFGNLKDGVGLVLQTHHAPAKLTSLTVTSDTLGWSGEIKAGASATGPFHTVSDNRTVESTRTTFTLNVAAPLRYYVIWITRLTDQGYVDVNEVTAKR